MTASGGFSGERSDAIDARRLSILHVVAPASFGGLESVVRALARGQVKLGHAVRVASVVPPHEAPHSFEAALDSDSISVTPVRIRDRDYAGERRAIRKLCLAVRADIVHTHGYRPDVVDGPVARSQGAGAVSTCHGFIEAGVRGRVYQWLQRRALRRFDAVVAVSQPIAVKLRQSGIDASRVHVIPNVIAQEADVVSRAEARKRLGLSSGQVVGWVGRLSAEKGPDIALQAFARIPLPEARLAILGSGPDEYALRDQAERLGVAERVSWLGVVADAGRFFPAFDVFLLSSRTEGTPIALLEAVAASVPVVATRVGGVPDVVADDSGLLVQSEDVDGIARALTTVLGDAANARERAQRARTALAERLDYDAWLSRYETVYRTALGGRTLAIARGG